MFQFATATQIVFGAGALAELPRLTRGFGARVWLVLGHSERHGADVRSRLEADGRSVGIGRVTGEPSVEDVVALVEAARAGGCEWVLAVGGGSVLDAGKALAALLANPGDPLDFLEVVGRGQPLTKPPLPFVAVPTTSGTGAEVTKNAVLASTQHGVKVSLRHDSMLPRIALVDPALTLSKPPALTAATGLDALTQVLEPFVSCQHNPLTDALAREGMRRGARALRRAYHDGGDLDARTDMALTSVLGGLCLANAKLGAVHGFAGPIGGMFPAPHGAVCARLLPLVVERNIQALRARAAAPEPLERFTEVARILTGRAGARAEDAAPWLAELVDELRVPSLSHYGLTASAIQDLVPKARRASSMQGNPIVLTDDELTATLEAAL
jgi:alcohol dehydrogenase class IV